MLDVPWLLWLWLWPLPVTAPDAVACFPSSFACTEATPLDVATRLQSAAAYLVA